MDSKNKIATIKTEIGQMAIFYNGSENEITAETTSGVVEKKEYIPKSLQDAIITVREWYSSNPDWELNMIVKE